MAKRKARSVWVWWDGNDFTGTNYTGPPPPSLLLGWRIGNCVNTEGYVEFREVLPKKRKVKRAKK